MVELSEAKGNSINNVKLQLEVRGQRLKMAVLTDSVLKYL